MFNAHMAIIGIQDPGVGKVNSAIHWIATLSSFLESFSG
jgi:hypothetical protein